MEIKRPLLLISNDDGFHAKGIRQLIDMVSGFGDIIVCAPDSARSGSSCAFSATTPLRLTLQEKREGLEVWSCNGTPTDCVKMALAELCPRKPDMVIGGINHGDNGSVNTHYSGTMGVTMEGEAEGPGHECAHRRKAQSVDGEDRPRRVGRTDGRYGCRTEGRG